jgi:hypothetical protein
MLLSSSLLLEDQVEPDLSIFLPFLLENQEVDQFCLEREETSKLPPYLHRLLYKIY